MPKPIQKIKPNEIIWEKIHVGNQTYLVTSDQQRNTYFLYEVQPDGCFLLINKGPTPVKAREIIYSDRKCKSISK